MDDIVLESLGIVPKEIDDLFERHALTPSSSRRYTTLVSWRRQMSQNFSVLLSISSIIWL